MDNLYATRQPQMSDGLLEEPGRPLPAVEEDPAPRWFKHRQGQTRNTSAGAEIDALRGVVDGRLIAPGKQKPDGVAEVFLYRDGADETTTARFAQYFEETTARLDGHASMVSRPTQRQAEALLAAGVPLPPTRSAHHRWC